MYSVVLGGQRGNRSEGVHLLAWLHVRFATHPNHEPTVNFPALPEFIMLTRGWNELLFSNFFGLPRRRSFLPCLRLLAGRSFGARFADVRLAIGFVSQWSGTPSPILSV